MNVTFDKDKIVLPEEVTFDTATAIWNTISRKEMVPNTVVCLSGVKKFDSALLSLLVECKKKAHTLHRPLKIENAPEHLLALSKVCGVFNLLFRA